MYDAHHASGPLLLFAKIPVIVGSTVSWSLRLACSNQRLTDFGDFKQAVDIS